MISFFYANWLPQKMLEILWNKTVGQLHYCVIHHATCMWMVLDKGLLWVWWLIIQTLIYWAGTRKKKKENRKEKESFPAFRRSHLCMKKQGENEGQKSGKNFLLFSSLVSSKSPRSKSLNSSSVISRAGQVLNKLATKAKLSLALPLTMSCEEQK